MPDESTPEEEDPFELRLRELEEKTQRIREKAQNDLPPGEGTELHSRLTEFEKRATQAKQSFESTKAESDRKMMASGDQGRGIGLGMSAAYMIIGMPLGFAFVGFLIDRATNGHLWVGILTLIGAVIGVTMVIVTINRSNGGR